VITKVRSDGYHFKTKKDGEEMDGVMEMRENRELVERLEAAATLLERTLGWLEERQRSLSGEVERISATIEGTRREEELLAKLEEVERELAAVRAAAAEKLPKPLEPLRRTLPSATAEMLAKHGIGEGMVDVRTLDAALAGLSLEQRIAVKSQLRRAGAVT
jgi:predicted RNase H-like nuclease (RuvC/YqgF family)